MMMIKKILWYYWEQNISWMRLFSSASDTKVMSALELRNTEGPEILGFSKVNKMSAIWVDYYCRCVWAPWAFWHKLLFVWWLEGLAERRRGSWTPALAPVRTTALAFLSAFPSAFYTFKRLHVQLRKWANRGLIASACIVWQWLVKLCLLCSVLLILTLISNPVRCLICVTHAPTKIEPTLSFSDVKVGSLTYLSIFYIWTWRSVWTHPPETD